jgi:hypothetical protein
LLALRELLVVTFNVTLVLPPPADTLAGENVAVVPSGSPVTVRSTSLMKVVDPTGANVNV